MRKRKMKNTKNKEPKMITIGREIKYVAIVMGLGKPLFVGRDKMNYGRLAAYEDFSDALKMVDFNTAALVAKGYVNDNEGDDYCVRVYPVDVSYEIEERLW